MVILANEIRVSGMPSRSYWCRMLPW